MHPWRANKSGGVIPGETADCEVPGGRGAEKSHSRAEVSKSSQGTRHHETASTLAEPRSLEKEARYGVLPAGGKVETGLEKFGEGADELAEHATTTTKESPALLQQKSRTTMLQRNEKVGRRVNGTNSVEGKIHRQVAHASMRRVTEEGGAKPDLANQTTAAKIGAEI